LTLEALAAAGQLHPDLVARFVAYGLITPALSERGVPEFDAASVHRLRKIRRLRRDLHMNLAGLAVALDLLDRIEVLQRELVQLRRHFHGATVTVPQPVGQFKQPGRRSARTSNP
jgi:DNA-binding transcriptional MerR regulator